MVITKSELIAALQDEVRILLHLASKVDQTKLDYRPTEKQRSTIELLRYLSFCGTAFLRSALDGNWDAYSALEAESKTLAAGDFPAAMERQKAAIRAVFAEFTDADLATRRVKSPTGEDLPLGRALLDLPLRFLVGYRMQLFLYAKAAGAESLGTSDCWWGIEWPKEGA